jgi:hypothetical protein
MKAFDRTRKHLNISIGYISGFLFFLKLYNILVVKPEGKRQLGRPRHR